MTKRSFKIRVWSFLFAAVLAIGGIFYAGDVLADIFNYTGPALTLVSSEPANAPQCPASVGNITMTVRTPPDAPSEEASMSFLGYTIPNASCPSPNCTIGGGLNLQASPEGGFTVTSASFEAIAELPLVLPGMEDYVESLEAYQTPDGSDGALLRFPPGIYCSYKATTQGVWVDSSFARSTPNADNLGSASQDNDPSDVQSSDANPDDQGPQSDPGTSGDGCTSTCEPVNTGTGNEFETQIDFTGAGSTGLSLTRYYNSQDSTKGAFGTGWHDSWHRGFSISGSTITVTRADGRQDVFTQGASGAFSANPNVTSTLSAIVSGGALEGYDLTLKDDTVEFYAPNGNLTSVTTRAGLVTRFAYNNTNQLMSVTGPFGAVMGFTYGAGGNVASMTAPDGGVYAYAYDSNNNLLSVKYPDTTLRQYVYENTAFPNALTGIIDENGVRYTTIAYDSQGRAIATQLAGGADLTNIAYNANGFSTVTDANGNAHTFGFTTEFGILEASSLSGAPVPGVGGTAFTYDANGFLASKTDFDGNVTTFTHDANGDETSRTEAAGTPLARTTTTTWLPNFHLPAQIVEPTGRTTSFSYDSHGNLLSKIMTSGTEKRQWDWAYNAAGQAVALADPNNNITSYAYNPNGTMASVTDALGHKTIFTAYDGAGRLLSFTDPNGLVTNLSYDIRGRLLSSAAGTEVTSYDYDPVGDLVRAVRPDGSYYTYVHDAAHRLTNIVDALNNQLGFVLDGNDNRVSVSAFDPAGTLVQNRRFGYDSVNRLNEEVGAQGQTTTYSFDPEGNLLSASDPLNDTSRFAYDSLNRRIQTTDANNGVTQYGYDTLDRLTAEGDPRGSVTQYAYDGLSDQTGIGSPDTGTSGRTFDAAGNVLTSTDARGNTTRYSYDKLNRVTQALYGDGTKSLYTYDQGPNGIGHLTSMNDPSGSTEWAYDRNGHVVEKTQVTGELRLVTHMNYNAAGQMVSMQYPSGRVVNRAYDAAGHVDALSEDKQALVSNVIYRPFGPAESWQQGNGTAYNRAFDLDGRITSITGGGSTITYGFDAANRIVTSTETGYENEAYGYDSLNRLTGYAEGTGTAAKGFNFAYDANGNRTAKADSNPSFGAIYGIAANSNRLLTLVTGTGQGQRFESLSYDASGDLLADNVADPEYNDKNYWLNDRDNDHEGKRSHEWLYDARGRMAAVITGDAKDNDPRGEYQTNYAINGLGERTGKYSRDDATEYLFDEQGHILGEYDREGHVIQETVWLNDSPVAVMGGSAFDREDTHFISPDNLNAPHIITDAHNRKVWEWHHKPFGDSEPKEEGFAYDLRFPGQIHDRESGLNYNMFRDYNSRLGLYVQSDPIGLNGGINTYGYVGSNPVSYVDPAGLDVFVAGGPQVHELHQNIMVGNPFGPSYSQSFGLPNSPFMDWPWQAWDSSPGLGVPGHGVVYENNDPITAWGPMYLKTTDYEDVLVKQFLQNQIGDTGPYDVLTYNCRNYSQDQFKQIVKMIWAYRWGGNFQ